MLWVQNVGRVPSSKTNRDTVTSSGILTSDVIPATRVSLKCFWGISHLKQNNRLEGKVCKIM